MLIRQSLQRELTALQAVSRIARSPAISRIHQYRLNHRRLTQPRHTQFRSFSLFGGGSSNLTTQSQANLAKLESEANADPKNVAKQLALYQELILNGAEKAVVTRWELAEEEQNANILASDEAFGLYLSSLSKLGQAKAIPAAVRRRDATLASLPEGSITPQPIEPSVSSVSSPSATAASTPAAVAALTGAGDEIGGRARPIHIVMEESRQFNLGRVARSLGVTALYAFCILTVLSLALENSGLMKAGGAPAEFEPEEGKAVKFEDVKGVDEAKNDLEEIVEFLRNPDKFTTLGGRCPKGILLTGPPGTGKTMLARAVAGEAGVPFLFASGSAFDEVLVGVGSKRIRELFAAAKKKAPAIIFIDELDAIGSKRTSRDQQYMKQTLNQLLVELDGFEQSEGVIIIAATNFPESLDKALTRPGRFDRHVVVGLPDVRGRIDILKQYMEDVQCDAEVDPSIIARGCPGMSGADLRNLVNEAAVKAARDGADMVKLSDFEWAKDRILMGAERKSHYVSPESKRMTAYHEAGHALTALRTPGAMPLHKVTIMPRGQALGITFQLPEADKDSYSKRELNASIDVALGGRAAEELIFGLDNTTTGCSSDLQRATSVAGNMVRNYGFSEKIGLVAHTDDDVPYLSGAKKDEIESEVRRFVEEGWHRTKDVLNNNMEDLHKLADALVEYETLSLDEVKSVLKGEKLDRSQEIGLGKPALRESAVGKVVGMNEIA